MKFWPFGAKIVAAQYGGKHFTVVFGVSSKAYLCIKKYFGIRYPQIFYHHRTGLLQSHLKKKTIKKNKTLLLDRLCLTIEYKAFCHREFTDLSFKPSSENPLFISLLLTLILIEV